MSDPKPWFLSWPVMVTAGVTALGALGTVMVKGAAYITLPERVEAGEVYDKTQDTKFNEYLQAQRDALVEQRAYQKALQDIVVQQVAPERRVEEWRDPETGRWWCSEDDWQTNWRCD